MTVGLGLHNLSLWTDKLAVTEIVMHEDFAMNATKRGDIYYVNDIALIRLPNEIEFGETVQPVCIAERDANSTMYSAWCCTTEWRRQGAEPGKKHDK